MEYKVISEEDMLSRFIKKPGDIVRPTTKQVKKMMLSKSFKMEAKKQRQSFGERVRVIKAKGKPIYAFAGWSDLIPGVDLRPN